jgi:hypothetical protein
VDILRVHPQTTHPTPTQFFFAQFSLWQCKFLLRLRTNSENILPWSC